MKRALLLIGLAALIAFSGCVEQDIRPAAAKLPEINEYVQKCPEGLMQEALFMPKDAVMLTINDIRKECGKTMKIVPYWYLEFKAGGGTVKFYVDEAVQNVLCVVEPAGFWEKEQSECSSDSECDDQDPSTRDECKGEPRKCVNTPITECANNDGYCPGGCTYERDNDCPAIDECQLDLDCSDSNRLTKDTCTGTPKTCHYELKSCEELGRHLCEIFEVCKGTVLPTTDSKVCCNEECTKTESCEGVQCLEEQKCVRGKCYDKSCAERELPLCVPGEFCTEDYFTDDFGIKCCTGECRRPCDSDANCEAGEICDLREEYCIAESCEDIGGKTCNAKTEECAGEIKRTVDNDECCTQCRLKKCEEMEGVVCDISKSEKCSNDTVESWDEDECCLAECVFDWCIGKPCAINQYCNEEKQECVLKTCEEMKGIDWEASDTCEGFFYETKGVKNCCIPTTCEDLGGVECPAGQTCSEETRLSTDVDECCVGNCAG